MVEIGGSFSDAVPLAIVNRAGGWMAMRRRWQCGGNDGDVGAHGNELVMVVASGERLVEIGWLVQ